jgi:phosphoribosyl 1,2-cyclic phosphate phosphodiesterase
MQLQLLGTGGADGVPSFFGSGELSDYAREHGGKDVRTRSGAVVDRILKIDFGPDTYAQAVAQGLNPSDWKWIVVTHTHYDHFDPGQLQYCLPPFVPDATSAPEVLGNNHVLQALARSCPDAGAFALRRIESFVPLETGPDTVTPIAAYHQLDEDSVNLIIENARKRMLYATDTGVYQQPTWDFIAGKRFDCVVIEATDGFSSSDYWGHLSCEEVLGMITRMRDLGCVDASTKVLTTHHAASGVATHARLEHFFEPYGITVGYDGLSIAV